MEFSPTGFWVCEPPGKHTLHTSISIIEKQLPVYCNMEDQQVYFTCFRESAAVPCCDSALSGGASDRTGSGTFYEWTSDEQSVKYC